MGDLKQILLKTTQLLAGDAMKCCRCGDELDLRDKYFLNGNGTSVLLLAKVSSGLRLVLPACTSPEGGAVPYIRFHFFQFNLALDQACPW